MATQKKPPRQGKTSGRGKVLPTGERLIYFKLVECKTNRWRFAPSDSPRYKGPVFELVVKNVSSRDAAVQLRAFLAEVQIDDTKETRLAHISHTYLRAGTGKKRAIKKGGPHNE